MKTVMLACCAILSAGLIAAEIPRSLVYVGTSRGLFASFDDGETWKRNEALDSRSIQAVAVHPRNAALIVAATTTWFYRSTDAGSGWTESALPPELEPQYVAFDVLDSNVLYALNARRKGPNRVWVSRDGGVSWAIPDQPPGVSNIVVTGTPTDVSSILYAATRFGLFKSIDFAQTWTSVGPPMHATSLAAGSAGREHPGLLYVGSDLGIGRSDNGGDTWTWSWAPNSTLTPPPEAAPWYTLMYGSRGDTLGYDAIAFTTGSESDIHACVWGLWFGLPSDIPGFAIASKTIGKWDATQLNGAGCALLAVDPISQTAFAGVPGHLLRRPRGATSWSSVNEFAASVIFSIAFGRQPLNKASRHREELLPR